MTRTKEYEHSVPIVPPGDGYALLISSLIDTHCSGREKFFVLRMSLEFFGKFSSLSALPPSLLPDKFQTNGKVSNSMMEFSLLTPRTKDTLFWPHLSSFAMHCKTYRELNSTFLAHLFSDTFGFSILYFFFSSNIWPAEGLIHPSQLLHAWNLRPNTEQRPHESFQYCQGVWYF